MKDFSVANPYTNNLPFPNTKAKVASPGQNDGTVFNADLVDETFGFYQAALNSAGYTPSGTVDNATTSQVLNAIFKHTDDAVDIIQGDITTIQGDITTIQGDITTIQGDITTIEANVNLKYWFEIFGATLRIGGTDYGTFPVCLCRVGKLVTFSISPTAMIVVSNVGTNIVPEIILSDPIDDAEIIISKPMSCGATVKTPDGTSVYTTTNMTLFNSTTIKININVETGSSTPQWFFTLPAFTTTGIIE